MNDNEYKAHPLDGERVDGPEAPCRKDANLCPLCGLDVPAGELRCPRCRALLVTVCSGACASCGSRSCLRGDDQA
jgi:hypothetical protein